MAETVLFPDSPPPWEVFERDCLAFPAIRGEGRFQCLASIELLMERFGARSRNFQEALRAYEMHRGRIQAIARAQIVAGNVTPQNEVLLKRDAFSFKSITFSPAVRENSYYFRMVRRASSELEDVLGRSAGLTDVTWDVVQDGKGRLLYVVLMRDFTSVQRSVAFAPDELENIRSVHRRLNEVWGDVLQERSHIQLQELTSTGVSEE